MTVSGLCDLTWGDLFCRRSSAGSRATVFGQIKICSLPWIFLTGEVSRSYRLERVTLSDRPASGGRDPGQGLPTCAPWGRLARGLDGLDGLRRAVRALAGKGVRAGAASTPARPDGATASANQGQDGAGNPQIRKLYSPCFVFAEKRRRWPPAPNCGGAIPRARYALSVFN